MLYNNNRVETWSKCWLVKSQLYPKLSAFREVLTVWTFVSFKLFLAKLSFTSMAFSNIKGHQAVQIHTDPTYAAFVKIKKNVRQWRNVLYRRIMSCVNIIHEGLGIHTSQNCLYNHRGARINKRQCDIRNNMSSLTFTYIHLLLLCV